MFLQWVKKMNTNDFEEKSYKQSIFKIILLFVVLNLSIAFVLYLIHTNAQKEDLFLSISEKSRAVGNSAVTVIEKALDVGIPIDDLNGTTQFLNMKLKSARELEYLILTDEKGEILSKSDDFVESDDKNKRGSKESIKGKFKIFSKIERSIEEEIQPFEIYAFYNIPLRIVNNNKIQGYLHVGLSNRAVDANIENVFIDIAIILLAAMIIGYEFLSYIFRNVVVQPMRDFNKAVRRVVISDYSQIDTPRSHDSFGQILSGLNENIVSLTKWFNQLKERFSNISTQNGYYDVINDSINELTLKYDYPKNEIKVNPISPVVINLRLVMFLMMFGETILIPAIPSYAAQFYEPTFFISKQMLSAIPIILNMIFVAAAIPFVPKLSYRVGFRQSFMIGPMIMAFGYFVAFMFESLTGFFIARSISAIGFSICYVTSQNYVAAYATTESRIQSYGIVTIAIGAAYICGAPIGGILIDNVGYRALFLISIIAAALCIIIASRYIVDLSNVTLHARRETAKSSWELFKIPELSFAVIFSSLPTRFMHTGVVCYLYPLYLQSIGSSQSVIGRVMMIYGVISFLFAPYAPKLIQKLKCPTVVTFMSAILIAMPMIFDIKYHGTWSVVTQLSFYTLFTIIYVSSLMSLLDDLSTKYAKAHTKTAILGFYFVFERIGMIVGPAITALVLLKADFSHALLYLGSALIMCNLIYASFLFYNRFLCKKKQSIGK